MDEKVSNVAIIVPIYNQERYLERALRSLEVQTDGNFLAFCVNDGSTDRSADILASFAVRDSRFIVLTQPNGGLSAARNCALEAALVRADVSMVTFLDGDDFVHPQLVEAIRCVATAAPNVLIKWAFQSRDPDAFAARRYTWAAHPLAVATVGPNVWCRAFPKEMIGDIRFISGTEGAEDVVFVHEVVCRRRPSVIELPQSLLFYAINAGSAMHRAFGEKDFMNRTNVLERLVAVAAGDPIAERRLAKVEIPDLLRQFYKHLTRTRPEERAACERIFRRELRALKARGLLRLKAWTIKDIRNYLRFRRLAGGVD